MFNVYFLLICIQNMLSHIPKNIIHIYFKYKIEGWADVVLMKKQYLYKNFDHMGCYQNTTKPFITCGLISWDPEIILRFSNLSNCYLIYFIYNQFIISSINLFNSFQNKICFLLLTLVCMYIFIISLLLFFLLQFQKIHFFCVYVQ